MSGGVDSTVTALLLQEQGFAVHGFFMELPLPKLAEQRHRVQEVADRLAIPLEYVDLRAPFSKQVIGYFVGEYLAGRTPNPCVFCNQHIKFGLLWDYMHSQGMHAMATGHYARIRQSGAQRFVVRGLDQRKDQSYFLARLNNTQLAQLLFPLGEWQKDEVYHKASQAGFSFTGEESQDVCFLSQGLGQFLLDQGVAEQTGALITCDGRMLGEHTGAWKYTVGQRRGLGLPDATPWYVVAINGPENQVIIGKNQDLFHNDCLIEDVRWHQPLPGSCWQGLVQLRSRHTAAPCEVRQIKTDCWRLHFAEPQRAITPGQFAVFYQDNRVLGSGVISSLPQSGDCCP